MLPNRPRRAKSSVKSRARFAAWQLLRLDDRIVPALLDPLSQPRFVNALTVPPIMTPTTAGGTNYEVPITQAQQNLGLVNPLNGSPLMTTIWGYNGVYPGPTFEAVRGQPITVRWNNQLISGGVPLPHLFPDELMEPLPASGVPLVTHLHGGFTRSSSDGLPEAWATPNCVETGADFRRQTYEYSNDQLATTLWYHDHSDGITRLNVYAGLSGFYLLREPFETSLNLPSGAYEVPMLIQDKMFNDDGSLYYPPHTVISGSVGNFILVNGKAWPALDVEPRKYRFRLLDGSDSRFYNLSLVVNGGGTAPVFHQIGTDQGFLEQSRTATSLVMAPAERLDVIIDFSDPALAGKTIVLTNTAPAAFPNGSPPDPATVGQIMALRVTRPLSGPDTSQIPTTIRPLAVPGTPVRTRQLLMSRGSGSMSSEMFLGTVAEGRMGYEDPVTETPHRGDTETWELYNNTPGSHPIHLHSTQFRILTRQQFTATADPTTGALSNIQLIGSPQPPRPENDGAKDTVIVEPGEVVRIVVTFDRAGEYVWHCHMLAHEDHDMMRPLVVLAPPTVDNVIVNGGAAQRSRVTSLTVQFDSLVTLPGAPAMAFELRRQSDNAVVALAAAVTNADFTSVTLTFTGGALDFGSLSDGRYTLTVFASQVSNMYGNLDGNDDGAPNDNYNLVGNAANKLFRLFGDVNGDATVNGFDLGFFRNAFGTQSGDANYLSYLDINGDGVINGFDLGQFRTRFGTMLP
jgi:spore coat protein A, manganese oxidase